MVRWGISSTGGIAHKFATDLALVEDAELVAVGSRSQAAADAFGAEFHVPHRHGSNQALAEDPEVDVVYVASPHSAHHDDTLMMLRARKAVLCEKPFAVSETQAATMTSMAELQGVFLMEALWSRFLPAYVKLRELLAEGRIGAPRLLQANFCFRVPDDRMSGHRLFDPHRAGGALLDLGIYPLNLAYTVFGEPEHIQAMADIRGGVDELTAVTLGWPGGEMALLHMAIRTPGSNTARIDGEAGSIMIDAPMHVPKRIVVDAVGSRREAIDVSFAGGGFQFQIEEVHRCLAAGLLKSDVMPPSDTLQMMGTLDRIRAEIGLSFPVER